MRRPKKDIQLTSYDELLGLEETPEKSMNQVVEIDLAKLYPFKNHPFHVNDDEKMAETVEKTDSLTTLSRIVEYYTLFSKSLQLIITYYSVCICCISVAHHIILLHLIELNPQGLFPRICSNYVIIFLLLLFFSYQ